MVLPVEWMKAGPYHGASGVFVWDTDALLGDACDMLSGDGHSKVLAAIDAGILVALMSEQAYLEVGRMYPKAARGRRVNEKSLREIIEKEYLPRARVVTLPTPLETAWAPHIEDVKDVDDIQHAQLARMVAPCSVYSHDKHLRRPGYAPADRPAYRDILELLATLTHFQEVRVGTAVGTNLAIVGVGSAVKAAAGRMRVRPSLVALGGGAVTVAMIAAVVRNPVRRRQFGHTAARLLAAIESAATRDNEARSRLAGASLVSADSCPRIEARVAAVLARNPDVTVTTLRADLGSDAPTASELRLLLRSHPMFVETRSGHWALGTVRTGLVR